MHPCLHSFRAARRLNGNRAACVLGCAPPHDRPMQAIPLGTGAPNVRWNTDSLLKIAHRPMLDVEKHIVTDEDGEPVAVQVDYADWLKIERRLADSSSDDTAETEERLSLKELSEKIRPHWTGGDGLEYQRRIRAEWERSWEDPEE